MASTAVHPLWSTAIERKATMVGGRFSYRHGAYIAAAAAVTLAAFLVIGYVSSAVALPSYARQTGQPCGTCHTDFAGLPIRSPFQDLRVHRRRWSYRSTLFPDGSGGRPYVPPLLAKSIAADNSVNTYVSTDEKPYAPPIAMMAIVGFTHTQASLSPPTAPYNPNNNIVGSPLSFFYGGAITDHIGAFQQVTWNAPPAGRSAQIHSPPTPGPGTSRHPLRQLDAVRAVQCHLRHHCQ